MPVSIDARFSHMALMQSELLETGARYSPLLTQALKWQQADGK
jgi:hypothetical protein